MALSDGEFGRWDLVSEKNGIRLEARKHKKSGLLETKVSGVVGGSPDEVWEALTTPQQYLELMPKTQESEHLVERPRKKEVVCYQRLSGGPSSDRDYTLQVRWTVKKTKGGKTYHRHWTVDNTAGPDPVDGVVRVEVNEGSWLLEPESDGQTRVTQQNYIELGGSIWKVLANNAVKEAALELLENLRKRFGR